MATIGAEARAMAGLGTRGWSHNHEQSREQSHGRGQELWLGLGLGPMAVGRVVLGGAPIPPLVGAGLGPAAPPPNVPPRPPRAVHPTVRGPLL